MNFLCQRYVMIFLEEYKEFNDPIRQFVEEILPQCRWKLLPNAFLYDLYKSWMSLNNSSGQVQGRNNFIQDLHRVVNSSEWKVVNCLPTRNQMDSAEPLVDEYHLTNWMNPQYMSSKDLDKKCRPVLKTSYSGLQRMD